jgi:hypothetical protein
VCAPLLWDLTDLTQPRQLGSPLHNTSVSPVNVVVFSPGGRVLATSSSTDTMLWNLTDPAQPHPLGPPLTGHSNWVWSVAFAPDGRTLATDSTDGHRHPVGPDRPDPAPPARATSDRYLVGRPRSGTRRVRPVHQLDANRACLMTPLFQPSGGA